MCIYLVKPAKPLFCDRRMSRTPVGTFVFISKYPILDMSDQSQQPRDKKRGGILFIRKHSMSYRY